MTASSQADGVRALAEPAAAAAGLVLDGVTVTPAGRRRVLRVTLDLPEDAVGGVPLEAVATASQALSAALDASDVMGGTPYVLEVSSPGIDRPLTERRHWMRARGRLIRATLADGGELTERLVAVDADGVLLGEVRLGWAALRKGRIEVEFNRPETADETDETDETDEDTVDEIDDEEQEV
jgi:ribosome maturation factor RimP